MFLFAMGQGNSHESTNHSDLIEPIDEESAIQFTINKIKYSVPKCIRPQTTLNYFIRNFAKLKGTKYMCLEGGCGVCIVAVKIKDEILAVNSCLVPIFLCNGWDIITIEGIGGKLADYNLLQKTLADMNGSQCGFCSPAMVMNMYSLIARKRTSANDIENSFGSNICRCTGYRSILDAFQLFSTNTASGTSASVRDIEDAHKSVLCLKNCASCNDFEMIGVVGPKPIYLKLKDADFFKVFTIGQIFEIFNKCPNASYILNGGNTGNGVYRISKKDLYLDINDITELQNISKSADKLSVCSAVSLENMRACCQKYSKDDGFEYLNQLAYHINLIGHLAMRNIGTIAGNLMLKHQHPEFQSDLFLILETAGAELHILESEGSKISSTFLDFMEIDMRHKLIYSVVLPRLEYNYVYKTYKIMPRAQNAHAIVNAGFLFRLDDKTQVLEQPNIIFGGISAKFFHASETEKYLKGKVLLDSNTLKNALSTLGNELKPDLILPEASPEYRKKLAQALFYKFILSLKPNKIDARLRSGGTMLERPISSGKTDYNVDKNLWPVNKPVTKIEAYYQTSGEAEYIDDISHRDDEVFCAFVLAPETGPIDSIDASEALGMDGVVAFYSAKDVPGKNVFVDQTALITYTDELLFAEKEVQYAGQPYGMIVASDRYAAYEAVKKVKLIYENGPRKRPLLTVEEVFASNDKSRIYEITHQDATKPAGKNVKNTIKGTLVSGSQYHFTMEPHVCFCIPLEDELNMFASTQFVTFTLRNVSACLGIPENKINIKVRRVGGAYGVRLTRSSLVACACAMAAQKLQRPARMYMTIEDMMQAVGKRIPTYSEYEVGIDDVGKIQYLNWNYWANKGISMNDTVPSFAIEMFKNIYDTSTWSWTYNNVITDLPCGTWCRSPGSAEGLAIIGDVMEQIARATHQDPFDVVLQNVSDDDRERVTSMIDQIKKTSEYEDRRKAADLFNKENRWKKRGVGTSVMKFHVGFGQGFHALVSVYSIDGTVSITHGGIEMGQGINTKVAQVAAYTLGIDMDMIRVKPTNNLTAPNDGASGASITSDCCASATKAACEELLKRLKPVKDILPNATWKDITNMAATLNIDLCASHKYNILEDLPKNYAVYGVTVAEVELDILTGQHIVRRVDLLEDTGTSLNPEIDAGQIQGAFVMGMGMWTTEHLIYDPSTGALANHRTWNYKPPTALDIPVDFRVSFLRNAPNPVGILGSKTTGEPALCMSCAIPVAIRYALDSARADAGNTEVWYNLDGPLTVEKIMLSSLTEPEQMDL
ncbi:indole-3-acetaldehyde oxidase [Nasonia vitripennis]|uniref:FAD-binding PCMH-type domain-containing protein n=1 Tax=Nasonia vitripennis TaxID=7425 RepID=A0A7M7HBI5_NASVI|nr:indole-3-acetaldehyde oxidase [Nasonia vitripennis]